MSVEQCFIQVYVDEIPFCFTSVAFGSSLQVLAPPAVAIICAGIRDDVYSDKEEKWNDQCATAIVHFPRVISFNEDKQKVHQSEDDWLLHRVH